MKSAQQQLEQAQRRLANLLSRSKPLFPKDYAKNLEAAQTDVEYWTAQAASEQQAAVNLFAPAAAVQPMSNTAPQVVYYNAPNLPDAASSTRNTVMAVGAIVAIVAAVAYLRVQT